MTTIHEDDITGEQYSLGESLEEFGLVSMGDYVDDFETHIDVVHEDPEAVAERLHEMVDDWEEGMREYVEKEGLNGKTYTQKQAKGADE